ncbi:helix-turn-helix transcriptional regulator [Chitinophaga oryzae]|uniref:Helix-turn-helix transcriptional regulator n=1 Tax=Chitinophaga oryzae TaxID=2725414 RepID=A0AAE7D641_9BACT|nr:helix-turn-helix domain-containing protein [Chitinophaga oryzae]QJB31319.1 helix-turn-helix transcriptional regulator [Chitinophaga oryzae]QJB37805.1 helix-turn-helix transcriptional regulator [Chitinophaga oryzae]
METVTCTEKCNQVMPAAEDALYIIAGKWKVRIIITLATGDKRFNELQRALPGISARVLSNELKDLELNGLVSRKVLDNGTILYVRNDYADSLRNVMHELVQWGIGHKEKIRNREI